MRWQLAIGLITLGCSGVASPDASQPNPAQPMPDVGPAPSAVGPTEALATTEPSPRKPPGPPPDPFGAGYPPALADDAPHGRVGGLTWGAWIQGKPDSRSLPLGSIRVGGSIPLTEPGEVSGLGKCSKFARVALGFVCTKRRGLQRATTNMNASWIKAARWTTPAPGPFPYEYAMSVGAPMLTRVPLAADFKWKTGNRKTKRLRGWAAGHDELAQEEPIQPNGPMPPEFAHDADLRNPWGKSQSVYFKRVPKDVMIAYTRAFEAQGQTYVVSSNMTVVPAAGLKRFKRSKFQGLKLTPELTLPIGWIRKKPRPKYKREGDEFVPTGEQFAVRTHVPLTGEEIKVKKNKQRLRYLETREPGIYVLSSDVSVDRVREKGTPWEVKRAKETKWIRVRVVQGLLTLYEGDKPTFSTLMSPGKEGATPYGRYRIESKHHVTTMTTEMGEPRKNWIADVPWTMYFKRPYAIHGAYWHEDFGMKKSGGCVNLSPIDAKYVFEWANPAMPDGWGSVQAYPMGGGTFVLVEA